MASSLMGSHGVALATAMALSGTVILMAICRPRPISSAGLVDLTPCRLRPCISNSAEKRREKKKKKVRFAENVRVEIKAESSSGNDEVEEVEEVASVRCDRDRVHDMPANRAALYNGILQYRLQRMACY